MPERISQVVNQELYGQHVIELDWRAENAGLQIVFERKHLEDFTPETMLAKFHFESQDGSFLGGSQLMGGRLDLSYIRPGRVGLWATFFSLFPKDVPVEKVRVVIEPLKPFYCEAHLDIL